ncbi:MAG: thrombospondin type 3 repeat-containing protein [Verrucomicrobiota bacterium]
MKTLSLHCVVPIFLMPWMLWMHAKTSEPVVGTITNTEPAICESPVILPQSGTITNGTMISIVTTLEGTRVRYNNGYEPIWDHEDDPLLAAKNVPVTSTSYTGPFSFHSDMVNPGQGDAVLERVVAGAFRNGCEPAFATNWYTFAAVPAPIIQVKYTSGTNWPVTVTISNARADAKLTFSLNGLAETLTEYTGPFLLNEPAFIAALAEKAGLVLGVAALELRPAPIPGYVAVVLPRLPENPNAALIQLIKEGGRFLVIEMDDDSDLDGQSNAAEIQAGTNPYDATSNLSLSLTQGNDGALSVAWKSLPGFRYELQTSTNLQEWTSYGSPVTGQDGTLQIPIARSMDRQFFRLRVPKEGF